MEFKTKDVMLEAHRWLPDDCEAATNMLTWLLVSGADFVHNKDLKIRTISGVNVEVEPGWYVVATGKPGDFYVSTREVLDLLFEGIDHD